MDAVFIYGALALFLVALLIINRTLERLLKRLFEKTETEPKSSPSADARCTDVIGELAKVMAASEAFVRDIRELPHSKAVISTCIEQELQRQTASAEIRNAFIVAYLGLANFQELSSEQREVVALWEMAINQVDAGTEREKIAIMSKVGSSVTLIIQAIHEEEASRLRYLQAKGWAN